jgi:hypothetical protein
VIVSTTETEASMSVFANGEAIVTQDLNLEPGRNRVDAVIHDVAEGRVLYEASVTAAADTFAENNRNGTFANIVPAPQVAVLAPDEASAKLFVDALAVQGLQASRVLPQVSPAYVKDWLKYDAIVLMNLPAIDLNTRQQEQIEEAVRDHGRGLLLLGGENAFGPGGYYATPLDRISPLSSRVPNDDSDVALVFVIDRSGSMQRDEGGASRLDLAKVATISAIGLLSEESQIGVVVFDSEARTIVPMQPARDQDAVAAALALLDSGGGTSAYPGLVEALRLLKDVDAPARHIVLMSDGLSQPADFPHILAQIRDEGISVSTVAIGVGTPMELLQEIAELGKGAFHHTRDFSALPSILSQEALLLSADPVHVETTAPQWLDREARFLAGAPNSLPDVHGYVATTRKPTADLHLVVTNADGEPMPLMASWRYGNGQVLALATQAAGQWTRDWVALDQYPAFWSQVVRHLLPNTAGPGMNLRLETRASEVLVTADVLDEAGMPRVGLTMAATIVGPAPMTGASQDQNSLRIGLVETTPGRYRGAFLADRIGDYVVRAEADAVHAEVAAHVPYPATLALGRVEMDRLVGLAAATGGRVIDDSSLYAAGAMRWAWQPGWRIWTLMAIAALLIELGFRYAPFQFRIRRPRPTSTGELNAPA